MPNETAEKHERIEDAIAAYATRRRSGAEVSIEALAREFGLNQQVLQSRVLRRYPDGDVGSALPTEEDNRQAAVKRALADLKKELWGMKLDGREVAIDGKRFTLAIEVPRKRQVLAIDHSDASRVHLTAEQLSRARRAS